MLAELWTAAGKPLEADRLQVYRQSLGEVPLGLLELASSATRVAETADGGLRPPRLVAERVGESLGYPAGDGGLGGDLLGEGMEEGVRRKEIPMWRFVGLVGRFGDMRSKPGRSQTPSGDASRRPSPNSVEEAQLLYDWADVGTPVVIQW